MVADDRPDYPAVFHLRLELSGMMQRDPFLAAVDRVLPRHPLLQAVVRHSRRNGLEWAPAPDPQPSVCWAEDSKTDSPWAEPIDPGREIGLRIHVQRRDGRTAILLQLHHACTDGLGAAQLAEELLSAYHAQLAPGDTSALLPPLDTRRLRERGKFGLNAVRYALRAPKELAGGLGAIEYFVHRPMPLASSRDDAYPADRPTPFLPSCTHTFTPEETTQLRNAARQMGGTTNDLLLRDAFLVLYDWNARLDPAGKNRVIRISVPINMRGPEDHAMPAADVVSMVFLDRRPGKFRSPKGLLWSIRLEMNLVKRWRLGLTMIHSLRLFGKFRGGLQRLLPEHRCLATSVVSNLGEPVRDSSLPRSDGQLVAGDLLLERIEFLPPIRPMTRASFGVVCYAGRLTLSLNYDARHLRADEGRLLLDRFVEQLRQSWQSV